MSKWTDFRNSFESFFQPEVEEAVNFVHAVEADVKVAAAGDLKQAFINGYSAYNDASGSVEDKLIVSITAFGSTLLGYGITIVKSELQQDAVKAAEATVAAVVGNAPATALAPIAANDALGRPIAVKASENVDADVAAMNAGHAAALAAQNAGN